MLKNTSNQIKPLASGISRSGFSTAQSLSTRPSFLLEQRDHFEGNEGSFRQLRAEARPKRDEKHTPEDNHDLNAQGYRGRGSYNDNYAKDDHSFSRRSDKRPQSQELRDLNREWEARVSDRGSYSPGTRRDYYNPGQSDKYAFNEYKRHENPSDHQNSYGPRDGPRSRNIRDRYETPEQRIWPVGPSTSRDPLINLEELIRAIRTSFPHVKAPTTIQAELIPAIHKGSDVILLDETGSGKTFGSVLALLSENTRSYLGISTLYIVPHRDLAYQLESWCQKLLPSDPSTDTLASHVRVLARPNVESGLRSIQKTQPRILITTPGALLDAISHPTHPLRLHISLRRIVVDEVDAVMNIPMRYRQPRKSREHRADAAIAIDKILTQMSRQRRPKPQMVMMSATLQAHVRGWLFAQNGWMSDRVVRLNGIGSREEERGGLVSSDESKVVHSAVVVEADGTLRNIEMEEQDEATEDKQRGILTQDPALVLEAICDDVSLNERTAWTRGSSHDLAAFESTASSSRQPPKRSITPSILEAIATSVALDVSNRAMLVVPAGFSVAPVVDSLQVLGIEARLLNLQEEIEHISRPAEDHEYVVASPASPTVTAPVPSAQGDRTTSASASTVQSDEESPSPTLLVTSTATIRGLDIPTLSHIYIVGGLGSDSTYRHIAGRVGRFRGSGTVISFIGAVGTENMVGGPTEERRLKSIYRQVGAKVVPFTHIQ